MKLVFNADDFGMSRGVNNAIINLAINRKISATTVMVNMPFWRQVVDLLKLEYFDIGLHFNIVKGRPVSSIEDVNSIVDSEGNFYPRNILIQRFKAGLVDTDDITTEFENQFNLLLSMIGERMTHIDSHHGLHNLHWVCASILKAKVSFSRLIIRSDLSFYIKPENGRYRLAQPNIGMIVFFGWKSIAKEIYYHWVAKCYQRRFQQLKGNMKMFSGSTLTILDFLETNGIPSHSTGFLEIACHPALSLEDLEGETMLQSRIDEYNMLYNHSRFNEFTIGKFREALI